MTFGLFSRALRQQPWSPFNRKGRSHEPVTTPPVTATQGSAFPASLWGEDSGVPSSGWRTPRHSCKRCDYPCTSVLTPTALSGVRASPANFREREALMPSLFERGGAGVFTLRAVWLHSQSIPALEALACSLFELSGCIRSQSPRGRRWRVRSSSVLAAFAVSRRAGGAGVYSSSVLSAFAVRRRARGAGGFAL